MIDLSIIIVNYNSSELLLQCINSLLSSIKNNNISFEIIIIDNNSKDKSIQKIEEFIEQNKIDNIFLIKNKINAGFAKATNSGILMSKGKYILLLNPDTIIMQDTFEPLIKFMENNLDVGALTCRLELKNGKIDQACHRGFPTVWNSFTYFTGLEKIFPKLKLFSGYSQTYKNMDEIHEIDSGCGAFLLIRKIAGDSINWLDEDYFWYGEDIDFCYRLKLNGWKIFFVPNIKVIHLKGASSGIKKHSKNYSKLDKKEKYVAIKSSTEVMRIYFKKHYQAKYPKIIFQFIIFSIYMLEKIRLIKFFLLN